MSEELQIVLCTCPDLKCAETLAGQLLERRLAGCISIIGGVISLYRWQGTLERGEEVQLLIKGRREDYPAIESAIRELHPYELPEILAVPVVQGLPPYIDWVRECTKRDD